MVHDQAIVLQHCTKEALAGTVMAHDFKVATSLVPHQVPYCIVKLICCIREVCVQTGAACLTCLQIADTFLCHGLCNAAVMLAMHYHNKTAV